MKLSHIQKAELTMNIRKLDNMIPTFVFEDHRTSLIPIWAAIKDGLFSEPPLLIRFDAHTDFAKSQRSWKELYKSAKELDDLLVISNSLNSNDGDWVRAAIELGLVSNVVTFFVKDIEQEYEEYKDHRGIIHKLIWFKRLSDQLRSHDGPLGDVAQMNHSRNKQILDAMGWNPSAGWGKARPEVWLDIDFDFAVHRLEGGFRSIPWSKIDFEDEFNTLVNRVGNCPTAYEFLREIILNSKLLTLAYEPDFCGGFENVVEIAYYLQEILSRIRPEIEVL